MVHFFGILHPGKLRRHAASEAPAKASFFGGVPDVSFGAVPLSRLEQDACYLHGKAPEPNCDDGAHGGDALPENSVA